jgi:hypothetical protein
MSNSVISYKDYVNNYGVVYQTTGGRRKAGTAGKKMVGGVSVRDFVTKIANNRVLDLYLKFMGITTLTTTTLVPIALLMGDEVFTKTVNKMTTEGEVEKGKIPILDDTLAAQYLKIAGLTTLTLAPATLIPLGVAMAIWQMYENSQEGQSGGSRTIFGSTIPQNFGQRVDNTISGIPNPSINIFPEQNDQLALACATGDCKPSLAGVDLPNNTVAIKGLPTVEIPNKVAQAGFVGVTDENGLSPAPLNMMGGRRKRQALLRKLRGGGSAWAMSQYSRGPVNYPNQNIADFRAFTKTGEYIPNTAFYPTPWFKPTPLDNVKTLYEQSPYMGDPTGYGVQGVAAAPFTGGKRRLSKKKTTKRGGFKDIGDSPDGPFTPSQLVNMEDLSGSMSRSTGNLNPMKGGSYQSLPGSDGAQGAVPGANDVNTSVGDWSGNIPVYANADASEGYPTYKLGNTNPTYSVPAQPFTGGRRKKDLGNDLSGYFN